MNIIKKTASVQSQRQPLLTLCRFLALRITYRFMILLLFATGLFLTVQQHILFAPYGIALVCLLLPAFLSDSVTPPKKTENSDTPLSALYKRYHYSPVTFVTNRITLLLCMLLLLVWHMLQHSPITLFGMSLPLFYLALCLILCPVLSRILFFIFHRRLMNGTM